MPDLFVMRRFRPAAALFVAVAATGTVACASSSPAAKSGGSWKGENAYGTEMARKGFWREALFRYEKAAAAQPANAAVQNNLGVAYESVGETSRALAAYKKALELSPQDPKIKRNYARFAEYYTSVQRASSLPAPSASAPSLSAPAAPAPVPAAPPVPSPAPVPPAPPTFATPPGGSA
ncbi:MAG: tetratricopeptide repeat protein [Acidobacteriota bacterium]|nr:tetratricopeptide repeat protein [Acidobacteriota bacterium]